MRACCGWFTSQDTCQSFLSLLWSIHRCFSRPRVADTFSKLYLTKLGGNREIPCGTFFPCITTQRHGDPFFLLDISIHSIEHLFFFPAWSFPLPEHLTRRTLIDRSGSRWSFVFFLPRQIEGHFGGILLGPIAHRGAGIESSATLPGVSLLGIYHILRRMEKYVSPLLHFLLE